MLPRDKKPVTNARSETITRLPLFRPHLDQPTNNNSSAVRSGIFRLSGGESLAHRMGEGAEPGAGFDSDLSGYKDFAPTEPSASARVRPAADVLNSPQCPLPG